jgi:hypothetical protein
MKKHDWLSNCLGTLKTFFQLLKTHSIACLCVFTSSTLSSVRMYLFPCQYYTMQFKRARHRKIMHSFLTTVWFSADGRLLWQNSTRMTPLRLQQTVAGILCADGVCLKIFGLRDPARRHSKDCYLLSGVMWAIPSQWQAHSFLCNDAPIRTQQLPFVALCGLSLDFCIHVVQSFLYWRCSVSISWIIDRDTCNSKITIMCFHKFFSFTFPFKSSVTKGWAHISSTTDIFWSGVPKWFRGKNGPGWKEMKWRKTVRHSGHSWSNIWFYSPFCLNYTHSSLPDKSDSTRSMCTAHNTHATQSHSAQHTTHTPLQDMLPHHHVTYKNIILPSVLT